MSGWRNVLLGEGLRVRHGYAFKGEFFSDRGDQIVLTPGNFIDSGGFKPKSGVEKYYTGPVPDAYVLRKGDVVVAMTEQAAGLLGSSATIPIDGRYLHNQRIGLIEITDPNLLDLRFVYHLMNSRPVREQLSATATGAKVRHTAPERIRGLRVGIPSLATQQIVGRILDTADELLEKNRRRAEVLVEMAGAIYREWFVHFRFPGHEDAALVDSELGPIPEGWEVVPLSQLAEITMGQSPRSEHYNTEGIGKPFHQGVTDFGVHFPATRKWCSVPGRAAREGDVLVSVRAPVGRINVADVDLTIGRGLAAVRAKDLRQALLLAHMRHAFAEEDSMGGGTIFKAIGKQELAGVRTFKVPDGIAVEAEAIFASNLAMIRVLTSASRRLAEMRDRLLPRLVTGRIDVSSLDLDALGEGAVA